jgi:hypothetical protein
MCIFEVVSQLWIVKVRNLSSVTVLFPKIDNYRTDTCWFAIDDLSIEWIDSSIVRSRIDGHNCVCVSRKDRESFDRDVKAAVFLTPPAKFLVLVHFYPTVYNSFSNKYGLRVYCYFAVESSSPPSTSQEKNPIRQGKFMWNGRLG